MTGTLALSNADDDPATSAALGDFDHVYASHAVGVHRFCFSQIGDAQLAADLTHDTFIKAFAAYERVRPDPESVRTWLIRIARNCCIDHHRQNGRWQRLLRQLQQTPEIPIDVEKVVHHRAELERVHAAMAKMRRRERELIGLRVAADLSYREVAEVMGISEQVVKVATRRALIKLRNSLENSR